MREYIMRIELQHGKFIVTFLRAGKTVSCQMGETLTGTIRECLSHGVLRDYGSDPLEAE